MWGPLLQSSDMPYGLPVSSQGYVTIVAVCSTLVVNRCHIMMPVSNLRISCLTFDRPLQGTKDAAPQQGHPLLMRPAEGSRAIEETLDCHVYGGDECPCCIMVLHVIGAHISRSLSLQSRQ